MQLTSYTPRYIKRKITTDHGEFMARFVVVSENNSFRLKLVDMVPLTQEEIGNDVLLIDSPKIDDKEPSCSKVSEKIISPFVKLEFFITQPTRAPSL